MTPYAMGMLNAASNYAAEYGYVEIIDIFIENFRLSNHAMSSAARHGRWDIVKHLLGNPMVSQCSKTLAIAVKQNNMPMITLLVESGMTSKKPLNMAICNKDYELLKLLLSNGKYLPRHLTYEGDDEMITSILASYHQEG
jgi:ankyrin repeat protein